MYTIDKFCICNSILHWIEGIQSFYTFTVNPNAQIEDWVGQTWIKQMSSIKLTFISI